MAPSTCVFQAALLLGAAHAVFLPGIFKDGMVLQTPALSGPPASLFGYANPGEGVAVNMTLPGSDGRPVTTSYHTTADSGSGKWRVVVAPPGPNLYPVNVTFAVAADSDAVPVVITGAAFGEVILCNGQSNLVLSVAGASYAVGRDAPPSAPLQNYSWPSIRLFSVITANSSTPQKDLPTFINSTATRCNWGWVPNAQHDNMQCQTWQTAVPTVTDFFSAECFHTAHQLVQNGAISPNVTIGLIQSAYSGTAMETWIPPEALNGCPSKPEGAAVEPMGRSSQDALGGIPSEPFCLWNSMVNPIVGYGMRAVIHNQIESNSGDDFEYYACVFQNMVAVWRQRWGIGPFPWFTTSLGDQGFSPDDGGKAFNWPSYTETARDGQMVIMPGRYPGVSRTPFGGIISSFDKGDRVANPFGVWDVHSRFKQELGRRMALVFQNVTGLGVTPGTVVDWNGPTPTSAVSNADGTITITWTTDSGAGVYLNGTQDCWECCDGSKALDTFQVAWPGPGTNFTNSSHEGWVNTTFTADEAAGTITLTPLQQPHPGRPFAVVRHANSYWPQCAVYSKSNDVPALSFSDLPIGYSTAGTAGSNSGAAGHGKQGGGNGGEQAGAARG